MNVKIIILAIMCFIAGLAFFGSGFYFLNQKIENIKKCGYISFTIGAVTVVLGAFVLCFPQIAALLALIYMILLILAFVVLYFMFMAKKN